MVSPGFQPRAGRLGMSIIPAKFIPPKTEAWKFSGLKELDLSGFRAEAAQDFYQSELGELPLSILEVNSGEEKICIERLESLSDLCIRAKRLVAHPGAILNYVLVNQLLQGAKNFNFIELIAHSDAKVNLTLINLGSSYTRQELTAIIKGAGADVRLRSLTVADGNREIDQRTLQIHEAPGAKSDLLFKNVLSGQARTIFSGMIRVAPGAQKTDAYQKNRNLILSDLAQANSLPGLEIQANDVRCSHGATCGKLDPEELFYLRSRGIAQPDAKRILVGGFCEEILEGLPTEAAEEVRKQLEL